MTAHLRIAQSARKTVIAAVALLAGLCLDSRLAAQAPSPSPSASEVGVAAGYEIHRDRFRYEFENPSNISTPFLVPHRFAQTYVADNQWLVASAHYRLAGGLMRTEFGITPDTDTHASDLDTFFNPGDDVVVSGTDGPVSMRALRLAQWADGRLWALDVRLGYVFRRDATRFLPTDRIVTHSSPPSVSRTLIGGNETTISNTHEFAIGVAKRAALPPGWRLTGGADLSPLLVARLTTRLPEKYPGQDILFQAKVSGARGWIELAQLRHAWPIVFTASYGHAWSYTRANRYTRSALEFGARVGIPR